GYDEIVQNVPTHLECLFEQLLKTPHHILTSRPYQNTLAYHVQMQITGFTDENIQQYVEQFFDQMKDELDNASIKSKKLFSFLATNRSIWGVAHIPVNLELICSLWSNEDLIETNDLRITSLYTMMIEWLCRRYLSMPNKNIQNLSKDDVNQRCEKELAFLENLAFNGMKSNTIILRPNLLTKALKEAKVSLHNHPHILNIGILKSFNKRGVDTGIDIQKDHYFVHLSFQEYFAARYLINALNGSSDDKTKATEFIKTQKYNQRYALVFTFVSGLCNENDANTCLNIFWKTILTSPVDLVGIRHIQLVICCIEETSTQSSISWQSENALTNEVITKLMSALGDESDKVSYRARCALGNIGKKTATNEVITKLMSALGDESERVRGCVCNTLGHIGEKATTNEVTSKLMSALGDESECVRSYACYALGKIGGKAATNEMITKLVSALGDENDNVRASALDAIGKMGEKAATNEVITKLMSALEDEKEDVRENAYEALGKIGGTAARDEMI
ncbi:unnamed protein product, partial [Didymodactylos carnosus]